jgi:hypothetical protein
LILEAGIISEEGILKGHQVFVDQIFMLEIMTSTKAMKDDSYFTFLSLFDLNVNPFIHCIEKIIQKNFLNSLKVWICLISLSLINAILWKLLSKTNFSFFSVIEVVSKHLIYQKSENLERLKNINFESIKTSKQLVLLTILIVWMLSSVILSKSYSSVLLKIYFRPKSRQIVETIDDIVFNQNLNILGNESLQYLKTVKPVEYKILQKRLDQYNEYLREKIILNNGISDETEILNEILDSETIFFLNTYRFRQIKSIFPDSKFISTNDKYAQNFITFFMTKNHSLHEKITFS